MFAPHRHWSIVATFAAILATVVPGSAAVAQQRIGVNSAVNPDANGTPPGAAARRLVVGQEVVHDEHVATGPAGQTQILFIDESALTIGPESDMTIDNFVFDPNTGKGQLAMSATQGVMRFVGGQLSKQENAVSMRTPSGTIGIRGGIFVLNVAKSGEMQVVFLFGKGLTVTGGCAVPSLGAAGCVTQTITRPGFSVSVAGRGMAPSSPAPTPSGALAGMISKLSGRAGATGGASHVPTDATVASSGIATTVSANVAASVQQATQNTPTTTTVAPTTVAPSQATQGLSTTAAQAAPQIANAQLNPTPPGTSTSPPPKKKSAFPNTTGIAGGVNVQAGGNPQLGFSNPITPYANGVVQNGVFSLSVGTLMASIPLLQGMNTFTDAGSTPLGPVSGTTFVTPDNSFFYADLTPVAHPNDTIFVYGGTAVNPSAFQATGSPQFLVFTLEPDAVLQSPIPFLTSADGGSLPNPTVSPLFLAVSPTTGFNASPQGAAFPKALQVSLDFDGQGANQSSVLMVLTGNVFSTTGNPGQTTPQPVLNGIIEGSYQANATSPSVHVFSPYLTAIDPNGNSFYGTNSISGFVLDSNNCCTSVGGAIQSSATETNTLTGQATNYSFNIPAVTTTLPANGSGSQTTQTLSGYASGIMNSVINGAVNPYAVVGTTAIETDATNLQIAAQLALTDPFTASTSGVNALNLSFGSLTPGDTGAREGYINDNLFAVMESPGGAGSSLNGNSGTAQLYLVNSNAVPNAVNSILPSGVSVCSCQYLQWGYWGGEVTTTTDGVTRTDIANINEWVAGTPTVNMPTTGSGSYSGAAVGTVYNNGATYVAAGAFSDTYNFGSATGTVAITNFDGRNFSGTVSGIPGTANYSGKLFGTNLTGGTQGTFYGPNAAETGGTFAIAGTGGLPYAAAGIFAGKLTGPIH